MLERPYRGYQLALAESFAREEHDGPGQMPWPLTREKLARPGLNRLHFPARFPPSMTTGPAAEVTPWPRR